MKKQLSMAVLVSACLIGFPRPAYGTAKDKDGDGDKPDPKKGADPAPPATPPPVTGAGEPFVPTGVPLHGNPNPGSGTAEAGANKRDETGLAKEALKTSTQVTQTGGSTGELQALLARSEEVRDGTTMPVSDIVALRISLQRFRGQGDDLARKVDEETNRLEVKKGQSITGQKRNK